MPAPLHLHPLLTLAGALLLPLATTQGQALPPPSQAIAVQATPTYHHGNTEMAGYLIEELLFLCFGGEILGGIAAVASTAVTTVATEVAEVVAVVAELVVEATEWSNMVVKLEQAGMATEKIVELEAILAITCEAQQAEAWAVWVAENKAILPLLEEAGIATTKTAARAATTGELATAASKGARQVARFELKNPSSFKGASIEAIKEYFKRMGWKIEPLKGKNHYKYGFRAYNPKDENDMVRVMNIDPSKVPSTTTRPLVKQGPYMGRRCPQGGWTSELRIPLEGNPSLQPS